jgi:hypothetical protein
LPQRSFALPTALYCRTQTDTRQIANQTSGGEFRACAQLLLSIFFFFIFARTFRPEYVEGDGCL